jgi:hypothetical protein
MIRRFRWRLARALAPSRIMHDPLDGLDGVFVLIRQDATTVTVNADRFRMKSSHRLRQADYGDPTRPFDIRNFGRSRSFTRFTGTVAQR